MGEEAKTDEVEPVESTDEAEVEIVGPEETEESPASDSGTPDWAKRRFAKLTAQREEARTEAASANSEKERLERENELLKLAQNARPKRDDFDDEDKYEAAVDDYNLTRTANLIDDRLKEKPDPNEAVAAHTERASKLKVSDYAETEDRAIEILGPMLSREVVSQLDKSELVMYHLGKNPAKAQHIADLVKENPVKATLELGRLEASLKVQPRTPRQLEPETLLEGGSPGATANDIDKMREAVAKETDPQKRNQTMQALREAKRAAAG